MVDGLDSKQICLHLAGGALLTLLPACAPLDKGPSARRELAPQNWTDSERYEWYKGSQGSRLIPEAWLMALEAPASTTLFMDPAHFGQFNYLSSAEIPTVTRREKCGRDAPPAHDALLPVGFARDCQSDKKLEATRLRWFSGQKDKENWIGLNCAACHTTKITFDGHTQIVDGAPTLADFQGFTNTLTKAMETTKSDPAKWGRFASRVVVPRRSSERDDSRVAGDKALLQAAFGKLLDQQKELAAFNQTSVVYGFGRLDAVGHILNKVAYLNKAASPYRGEPNAPVSYPFIWNAHQHDFVQWNGLVPNKNIEIGLGELDVGALVRNTSEVIGVFADLTTRERAGLNGYQSSVAVSNMVGLENRLETLMSPQWPTAFGPPDPPQQVADGKRLFESRDFSDRSCKDCHATLPRDDLSTPIIAEMTPIWGRGGLGTDPWMACNTFAYQAKGGRLTGTKDSIASGEPLPAVAPTRKYLKTQAIGVLLRNKFKIVWIAAKAAIGIETQIGEFVDEAGVDRTPIPQPRTNDQRLADCIAAAGSPATSPDDRRSLAYKGRPLNGIWATAPYLHNGSVRTLYDLLLPPAQRPPRFWVGNREFDVDKVGFVNEESDIGSWFSTKNPDGSDIIGSSNLGHDYGNARLGKAERQALVAYMKTL